ncbi:MAG: hypothetical protein WA817_11795 [Candidatus Acidiferrum sp.]
MAVPERWDPAGLPFFSEDRLRGGEQQYCIRVYAVQGVGTTVRP